MNKVIVFAILVGTFCIGSALANLPSDDMNTQTAVGSLALFGDDNIKTVQAKVNAAKAKKGLAKAIALSKAADSLEQLVSPVVVILKTKAIQTALSLMKGQKIPNGLKAVEALLDELKNLQQELSADANS